ncbi:hypothetical protein A3I57_00520 [Candidatus Beckwithbacteria bacterium RIFCSPLOWO2_02_FULL_47_23]|uniref:HTH cro/C1-type domain-containing protein n=1 Tax=Candidatus Beckwithbacteria bacterium RIFCSPLOWO2_02_FULL_47_23 TaxID=1797463 RepID=A0A1F5DSC2_9BACT|nr:MAG: hypothetical protein A3I57_00520 [Candidatus Beckwithbacteria bacterium RIFCSPLOWO2_02_FULL_47_23]
MLTVGEILRERRLELKLTFTNLSELTKIPLNSLKALEKNQFDDLPEFPFLKGMVQNYAKALNLDPAPVVAVFKRDYDQRQNQPAPINLNKSLGSEPLVEWLQRPLTLFLGGLILLAGLVAWSLWRVYQPPRLVIESPIDGQTAISPVAVAGKTDRDASLSLNDKTINLEPDGSFETTFADGPGSYELVFKSTSRRQKTNETKITVIIIQ